MRNLLLLLVLISGCQQVNTKALKSFEELPVYPANGNLSDNRTFYVVELVKPDGEWVYVEVQPQWSRVKVHLVEQSENASVYHEVFSTPPLKEDD